MRTHAFVSLLSFGLFVGCVSEATQGQPAPAFDAGTGQAARTANYPAAPYGFGVGSVIPDYAFMGIPRSRVSTALVQVRLSDFYNPDGGRLYPTGSPYGEEQAMPKALVLQTCVSWSAVCITDAMTGLPARRLEFGPLGAEFLVGFEEGVTPGRSMTPAQLQSWGTKYSVDYPIVLSLSSEFGAIDGVEGVNVSERLVLIRTADMKIVAKHTVTEDGGLAVGSVGDFLFRYRFDRVLAGLPAIPGD